MKYAWQTRGLYKNLDAQVAGDHIDDLIEKYKEHLTPDEVLADARRSHSPLHTAFEWDDSKAAEKYRRRQARDLVNNLVPVKNGKRQKTRAFVLVKHAKHGRAVFMNVRSAMGRKDMADQVVEKSIRQLERWITSWGGRPELRLVHKRVEALRKSMYAELMTMV